MSTQEVEPLTYAYIAKGAFDFLRDIRADKSELTAQLNSVLDGYDGELGFISAVLVHAEALETAYQERPDDLLAVFEYEVAEPFGSVLALRMASGAVFNAREIADELVKEACK